MNDFLKNKANSITIFLIIAVLAGGVFWFVKMRDSSSATTPILATENSLGEKVSAERALSGSDLISVLSGLRLITLDNTLFEDSTFSSLEDFGVTLQIEPIGRYNPFLPIGLEVPIELPTQNQGTTKLPINFR